MNLESQQFTQQCGFMASSRYLIQYMSVKLEKRNVHDNDIYIYDGAKQLPQCFFLTLSSFHVMLKLTYHSIIWQEALPNLGRSPIIVFKQY